MKLDPIIEKMFMDIAKSLKLVCKKTQAPGGDVYNFLQKDKFLVMITTFIDRDSKLNIIVNFGSKTQRPVSWGAFKRDELMTRAKSVISDKLIRLMEKK